MNLILLSKAAMSSSRYVGVQKADIGVQAEKIAAIDSNISTDGAKKIIDASHRYVFPGAIDSHFHIGIYRPLAEDAASESTSAASGGVTTILSYFRTGRDYLNKIGPYREILPELLELSSKSFLVDYGYHLACMTEEHINEIEWLVTARWCVHIKILHVLQITDPRRGHAGGQ